MTMANSSPYIRNISNARRNVKTESLTRRRRDLSTKSSHHPQPLPAAPGATEGLGHHDLSAQILPTFRWPPSPSYHLR